MQVIVVSLIFLIMLAIFVGIKYVVGELGYKNFVFALAVIGIFFCARGLYQVRLSNENIRQELERMRLERDRRRQDEADDK